MFKTFRALSRLSRTQRETLDQKYLSGNFVLAGLLDDLRALSEYDRIADDYRRSARTAIPLLIFFTIFAIFPVAMSGFIPLVALPIGLAVSAIAIGISLFRLRRLDLSNNVRGVALPFLSILKQDIPLDQPVQLKLDLSVPNDASKCVKTSEPYQRGFYTATDSTFHDAWFEGSARLHDGAVVRWRIVDEVLESERTKRNRRGKTKTKIKHYKRSEIAIAVGLPVKSYQVYQPAPAPGQKVAVEPGAKRCTIKLEQKVKVKSLDPIDPRLLIDAISSAYRAARPVT